MLLKNNCINSFKKNLCQVLLRQSSGICQQGICFVCGLRQRKLRPNHLLNLPIIPTVAWGEICNVCPHSVAVKKETSYPFSYHEEGRSTHMDACNQGPGPKSVKHQKRKKHVFCSCAHPHSFNFLRGWA